MKIYTLTMRIETDDEITAERIRAEIYNAGEDLPFGFDITDCSITEN